MAITRPEITEYLHSIAEQAKATYPSIKDEDLMAVNIIVPSEAFFSKGEGQGFVSIYKHINLINSENHHLRALQSLLTSKLA